MTPMQPMQPLQPIKVDAWWPSELGSPSTSGAADNIRYAYFPDHHRLVIEREGNRTVFDTADYQFRGVLQSSSEGGILSFLSQNGSVDLDALRKL